MPVVIGHLKPIIYLPFSMVNNLSPDQIEAILLHELAHVKRYDFLLNVLQTIVETILFFNPFVWWISKNIRTERENCCDDLVLSATQPDLYANALLALEENRLYKGRFVMAAKDKDHLLLNRIKRIMEKKTKKTNPLQKLLVLLVIAGSITSIAWLTPGSRSKTKIQKETITTTATVPKTNDTNIVKAEPLSTAAPTPPSAPAAVSPKDTQPPVPAPPAPPAPPKAPDDPAMKNVQSQIKQYTNSADWKQFQENMKQYAQKMKSFAEEIRSKYANSTEWKQYQQDMKAYGAKLHDYFNNPKWKKQQKQIREESIQIKKQFNSPQWKHFIDSIKTSIAANRPKIDSVIASARQQILSAKQHSGNNVIDISSQSMSSKQIMSMLIQDGLIQDNNNYKVRINNKGLYINNKKQPEKYFKKYHKLLGTHTQLEVKKKKGNVQTIINTVK